MVDAREFPEHPEKSCINCGFLGFLLGPPGSATYYPAGPVERASGIRIPQFDAAGKLVFVGGLHCWRRGAPLNEEAHKELPANAPNPPGIALVNAASHVVATRERAECTRFHPWVPQWNEDQHFEEWRMDRVEEQRRAWQADLEAMSQSLEDAREAARKNYEDERETERREERNRDRMWTIGTTVLAMSVGAAATLAAGAWFRDRTTVEPQPPAVQVTVIVPMPSLQSVPDTATPQQTPTE
jgi:hypothetical protein